MTWLAIVGAGIGCYLLKLAGVSLPSRVLEHPIVERIADLIPVALLAALVWYRSSPTARGSPSMREPPDSPPQSSPSCCVRRS
jgi:hypothetical protein